jgi:PPOX class probable F420-dependent enzyme
MRFCSSESALRRSPPFVPTAPPHVAPVWFVLDSDKLVFMTGKDTVKGKNMLRDPRVMLSIDDERPPFAFVLIEGAAVASELSPAELLPWSTRIAKRYMGAEQADAYGKRNAVAGELNLRGRRWGNRGPLPRFNSGTKSAVFARKPLAILARDV